MKAELKRIHSPDVDLSAIDPQVDHILVQLMIGPENSPGEESFDVTVCTPEWRDRSVDRNDPDANKYLLVLDKIDADAITRHVNDFLHDLDKPTWQDLAHAIGRLGQWEFLDYRP